MITTRQVNQISQYIRESGIKYYDLEQEIVDHIAEWMTMDMEVNKFTFKTSFERLPDFFSKTDLKNIQSSRKKYLSKKYYAIFLSEWKNNFTWPKLIIQILLITLSILFFSIIKDYDLIGDYLFQIQFIIIVGLVFLYRFREIYKLTHQTNNIQKLLPMETIGRVGLLLRFPFYACYILASLTSIFTDELPMIFYQIMVYSFAIQIPYFWALVKTEADSKLRLIKEYPEAFVSA